MMAQIVTFVSLLWAIVVAWYLWERFGPRDPVRVSIHLDAAAPGARLRCDVVNASPTTITLIGFAIVPRHPGHGRGETAAAVPLPEPAALQPGDHAHLSIDVDWRLLSARSIAVCDASGSEHRAPAAQLEAVQAQLHDLIDRRVSHASARDWLFGATNLAFGVMILGLGFFMLMWVIATG